MGFAYFSFGYFLIFFLTLGNFSVEKDVLLRKPYPPSDLSCNEDIDFFNGLVPCGKGDLDMLVCKFKFRLGRY